MERKADDELIVRCPGSRETWYMTCGSNNQWIGQVFNCSSSESAIPKYIVGLLYPRPIPIGSDFLGVGSHMGTNARREKYQWERRFQKNAAGECIPENANLARPLFKLCSFNAPNCRFSELVRQRVPGRRTSDRKSPRRQRSRYDEPSWCRFVNVRGRCRVGWALGTRGYTP